MNPRIDRIQCRRRAQIIRENLAHSIDQRIDGRAVRQLTRRCPALKPLMCPFESVRRPDPICSIVMGEQR